MTQRIALRALDDGDGDRVAALLERLSSRSRYLRFFSPGPVVSPATVRYLASVDHDRHEAVGAFADDVLVGAAHYFRSGDDPSVAEISVEVADEYQRHHVGPRLLVELARLARQRGITHFTATALRENAAVLSLLRHSRWPAVSRLAGPELEIALTLPPPASAA